MPTTSQASIDKQALKWTSENYDSLTGLYDVFVQISQSDLGGFVELVTPDQFGEVCQAMRADYAGDPDKDQLNEIFTALFITEDVKRTGKAEKWTANKLHQWLWDTYTASGEAEGDGVVWQWEGLWQYVNSNPPAWPASITREQLVLLLLELQLSGAILCGFAGIDIRDPN